MSTIKSHKFDVSKVSLKENIKNKDPMRGKQFYVNYDNSLFRLQTPVMSMPYNIGIYGDNGENKKYTIDVAFRDLDSDYRVKGFHDNMKQLEEFIKEQAMAKSKEWFGNKKLSKDVVEDKFNPIVKQSIDKATGEPDGRYADTIKFKLPFYDEKPSFVVKDFDDNVIENPQLDVLFTKESRVQALLKCGGVYVISGKYGCTWSIEQIRIDPKEVGGGELNFINDSDDSDNDEEVNESSDDDSSDDE
tara:strand:- start:473 stop:1210 length:738 start_codon:yes stop_codon:yes gene_type:complete